MKKNIILDKVQSILYSDVTDKLTEICHLLKNEVAHYDWVGIYKLEGNALKLSSYVGESTDHVEIPVGRGICGQVAEKFQTIIVQDVTKEVNYISCGNAVKSEIVVPVIKENKFIAEIDIDSHRQSPFSDDDKNLLEGVATLIEHLI